MPRSFPSGSRTTGEFRAHKKRGFKPKRYVAIVVLVAPSKSKRLRA